MLIIGCHLSSSKGYLAMGKEAVKIGANDFQFFKRPCLLQLRNPAASLEIYKKTYV